MANIAIKYPELNRDKTMKQFAAIMPHMADIAASASFHEARHAQRVLFGDAAR
jgi:hypothetical protein